MKRLQMLLGAALLANAALAQFDDVKTALLINKTADAKQKLEAAMAKPKNQTKPEGFLLKAAIMDKMAKEPGNESKVDELRAESIAAYKKYLEMDPAKTLVNDPTYQGIPISYYMDFFNTGYKAFQGKEWEKAAGLFTNTVEWGDFLISNKMVKMEFDTNAHVLAGAAYQNWKKEDEATKYFTKVTDKKIGGEGNDFIYQFLMGYYFRANEIDKFEAIRTAGKELYPTNEYFGYTEIDFIMDMSDENEKMKRIEGKIAKEPGNQDLIKNYGLILFDKLNKDGEEKPANSAELESKMVDYLSRAGEASPNDGRPYYYLGNHFVNKAVRVNEDIRKVGEDIRKANANAKPDKSGKLPPPPKELTDKRDQLRKAYDAEIEKALPFLIKSAEAYGRTEGLKGMDLQNYKRLADQLILIYGDKKAATKVPAEKAKWEAEEKKWNDIYGKISH
ncbi:MAG: hypothetical protein MUF62_05625 [Chitinophagaceae bacterium]|nr:hypothetical protein [Chitinophagaceae bacterium]